VVRREAVISVTEDLNVKVCEEAITCKISVIRSICSAVDCRLEAITRYCDAAITCRRNNRRDDEGHRLAAALGAGLSRWRGA
jgi:hypothetical protein